MAAFHVRYWFDSNAPDETGEQIIEVLEAASAELAAGAVRERMRREPLFAVAPAFGPAAERGRDGSSGLVLIQAAHVRYVEIIPAPTRAAGQCRDDTPSGR